MVEDHPVCDCFPLFTFEIKALIHTAEYGQAVQIFCLICYKPIDV